MNYIAMLNNDEIMYICYAIPSNSSVEYFKHNPKYFSKIKPGFRPTSIKNEECGEILYKNISNDFISSFINKHIKSWLDQIDCDLKKLQDKGLKLESCWLRVLPKSSFANNISIYFKLTNRTLPNEYIGLLGESVKYILEVDNKKKDIIDELENTKSILVMNKTKLENKQKDLNNSSKKIYDLSDRITVLKTDKINLKKEILDYHSIEQKLFKLEKKNKERDETIMQLKKQLSIIKNNKSKQEKSNRNQVVDLNSAYLSISKSPKIPSNMDEFVECIGYNFECIGMDYSSIEFKLLCEYITKIIFTGKPILINKKTSILLLKCISNALVNTQKIEGISYNEKITIDIINSFLSKKFRIVCLDNFIGHFDETVLQTICDKYKDKIIFLTFEYENTLRFVPSDLLVYFNYININRIDPFLKDVSLNEDGSSIDEIDNNNLVVESNKKFSNLFNHILSDLGFSKELSLYKSQQICDEDFLCESLLFDVIPYCIDVMEIDPFIASESLNRYILSNNVNFHYKDLFMRLFL